MFSFIVGRYLTVELLGHIVHLSLTFWETAKLFSKLTAPNVKSVSLLLAFFFLIILFFFF